MSSTIKDKVIENWKTDEKVFRSLQPKDIVGEKEVVFETFDLARKIITTIKEIGLGKLEIKEYSWRGKEAVNNKSYERVNPKIYEPLQHAGKKIGEREYNELNDFLMEVLRK